MKIFVTDRVGQEHVLEAAPGQNVMELLRELDNGVEALCGGMCSCATCHVFIDSPWFARFKPAQGDELELLEETECYAEGRSRLSCQVELTAQMDGLRLVVAPEE